MSKVIHPKGSPHSQVWVIVDRPYDKDAEKGFIFSCPMGYIFDKMMADAGLRDYYIIPRFPDLESKYTATIVENHLNHHKPPIIITLGDCGKYFCPELAAKPKKKNGVEEERTELDKYAGSLLQSRILNYPHYVLPTYTPDKIVQDWSLRDIVVSLDLGKVASELEYYRKVGRLQNLPQRELKYDLTFNETIAYLKFFSASPMLSVDIETIYPNVKSIFWPHPGYPISIGIANSSRLGISFNLFWDDPQLNIILWRTLAETLSGKKILGQNFFIFDAPRLNSLGFSLGLDAVVDTMIRHHILWPELPHKLQFMTRQYTREPYYKDEGKRWSIKELQSLRRYNCLDVCVTYEVYEQQELEFNERPYLR